MTPALAYLATFFVACASTPGAKPHDMSASQHEAMAAHDEQSAAAHAAQYDPKAPPVGSGCSEKRSNDRGDPAGLACWSTVVNPTAGHLQEAERHRKMAADHRAASQALKDAEANACAGISEEDRDMSPFEHREDIAQVAEFKTTTSPRPTLPRLEGAIVSFRAIPGMTAQWLQRIVDCHIARNAALGYSVPEMPYCPLALKDVKAKVVATSTGFDVTVRSDNRDTANEIVRRTQALVGR
jgi:hypothetical protein